MGKNKKKEQNMLKKELNFGYGLLKKTFSIEFTKPQIYYGCEHLNKFHEITSMRDLAWSPEMAYRHEIKGIYVPEHNTFMRSKGQRLCCLLHELGHAFIDDKSPELNEKRVEKLLNSKRYAKKGYVYCVMHEAIADYMSIESCKVSGDEALVKAGQDRDDSLKQGLEEWINSRETKFFALRLEEDDMIKLAERMRALKPDEKLDWQKAFLNRFSRDTSMMLAPGFPYLLGYHFMSNMNNPDIKKLINNPPKTVGEIIYPEKYSLP